MERYIVGAKVKEIETPALLLDLDKVEYNLNKMATFIKQEKKSIRPHFKTHKSAFLAHKQIEAGANGIDQRRARHRKNPSDAGDSHECRGFRGDHANWRMLC